MHWMNWNSRKIILKPFKNFLLQQLFKHALKVSEDFYQKVPKVESI